MRTVKAILVRNFITSFRDKWMVFGFMLMPVAMIVFQDAFNNFTAVLSDIASGFMKEIIVAPVKRESIAVGSILSAVVIATMQGIMVLALNFIMGFRTTLGGFVVIVLLMLLSGVVLSAAALFLSLAAKNQTNYQMISSPAFMPAMFLSGAYIPTTVLPKVILPFVYVNSLTYLTGAFRYAALGMLNLSVGELVCQGVAIRIGFITITPAISWIFVLAFGALLFVLCVRKFKKVNLAEITGSARGRR